MFKIEKSLGFLLAKCHQRAFHLLKHKLQPYQLTPPQLAALFFLWEKDLVSQIRLGELMDTDNATLSGILDRLEKTGYTRREPNPGDRRSFVIAVTEKGWGIRQEIQGLMQEQYRDLTRGLTAEEVDTLTSLLVKFRETIKK